MTFPDLVKLAQIVGALGFPVALYALWRAQRDILAERRASHELEVLRHVVDLFHILNAARNWPSRAQTYLLLIHGSANMPMSRQPLTLGLQGSDADVPSEVSGSSRVAQLWVRHGTWPEADSKHRREPGIQRVEGRDRTPHRKAEQAPA
jgi:hypothetical protein